MKSERSYKLRMAAIIAAVISIAIVMVLLVPSIFWAILGQGPDSFVNKQVFSSIAPDGAWQLVIYEKVDFPIISALDPPITVTIELKKPNSWGARNSIQFGIHEYSELTEPSIVWTNESVTVTNIDYHKEYTFAIGLK